VDQLLTRATVTLLAVLVAVTAAVVPARASTPAACAGTGPVVSGPTPVPDAAPGVTEVEYTFVDRTRAAPALPGRPARACRELPVVVRVPAEAPGARPLIIAVHGRDGDPSALAPLLDTWARAGYVVAAPHFLVTKKARNGKALGSEIVAQAADARFVLTQVLARADGSADPVTADPVLAGRVDPSRLGAAGMSLGGQTVYGLISHGCCRDTRLAAAVVMAGVHDPFPTGDYDHQGVPVLLIQGDADVGYHHSRDTYPQLEAPKWFVTLRGERHSAPFEVPRDASSVIVDATTTAFWDLSLGQDPAGAQRISAAVDASNGKATLQHDLG
jgi:dienelactone hydrolase